MKYTDDFISTNLKLVDKTDFKFVVFIENWATVDEKLVSVLLEIIKNSDNIRLVIGNRNKDVGQLNDFLLSDNFFEITPEENDKILERVSKIKPAWSAAIKTISFKELNQNPIYIVLFIISRYSSDENFEKTEILKSRFAKIIESDLKKMAEWSKGFAVAFYYWACIYKEYKIYPTWKALLAIADHYNDSKDISNKLMNPENKTFIDVFLKRYISFSNVVNPDLNSIKLFKFNHPLLATEGFAKATINIPGCLSFNHTTFYEIAEILIAKKMYNSAQDLIYCLLEQGILTVRYPKIGTMEQKAKLAQMAEPCFFSKEVKYIGLYELGLQDELLELYYKRSHNSIDTRYFAFVLNKLIYEFAFSTATLLKILKSYIENGCKLAIVHKAYAFLKQGKLMAVEKMLDSTLDWEEGFMWHTIRTACEFYPPRKFVELDKKRPVVYTSIKYWAGLY